MWITHVNDSKFDNYNADTQVANPILIHEKAFFEVKVRLEYIHVLVGKIAYF